MNKFFVLKKCPCGKSYCRNYEEYFGSFETKEEAIEWAETNLTGVYDENEWTVCFLMSIDNYSNIKNKNKNKN